MRVALIRNVKIPLEVICANASMVLWVILICPRAVLVCYKLYFICVHSLLNTFYLRFGLQTMTNVFVQIRVASILSVIIPLDLINACVVLDILETQPLFVQVLH
jgi:hypothetical protein